MTLGMSELRPSSWNKYPHYYKFISAHFVVKDQYEHTTRVTYSLLDFASDCGGLVRACLMTFTIFVKPFAKLRRKALLTKRLYHLQNDQVDLKYSKKRKNGEFEIVVHRFLDWQYLKYLVYKYVLRKENKNFEKYRKNIMLGTKNTQKELDIVNFIRRQRSHTIGLHFLLNKSLRNLSARIAFSKSLKYEDEINNENLKLVDPSDFTSIQGDAWIHTENLQP